VSCLVPQRGQDTVIKNLGGDAMVFECSSKERVITVRMEDKPRINTNIYLISDAHFDSISCDRKVLKTHLDKALQEDALIIIGGDWYDAMQGKFDSRRNMNELRPEYRTEKYYDVVVDDSVKFLQPYAKNILAVLQGNHELSVRRNSNTDLTDRLTFALRSFGSQAVTGNWNGWIKFILKVYHSTSSVKLYYSHNGASGQSPVTRGVLSINKQATYEPDADIVWNGHTHTAYIMPVARERLSSHGDPYYDIAWYVRTPGYKRDWEIADGYVAQKGLGPQPIGCAKINIYKEEGYPQVNCNFEIVS